MDFDLMKLTFVLIFSVLLLLLCLFNHSGWFFVSVSSLWISYRFIGARHDTIKLENRINYVFVFDRF